jgi:inorganic pyrophosphatase
VTLEIKHFFDIYKQLEPGKKTDTLNWDDREAAESEIATSQERFRRAHAAPMRPGEST